MNGDVEGARAALERGEDVNQIWQHGDCENPRCAVNPNCNFKAPPLHAAIKRNHSDVVALLLQQPGVDVNLNIFGFTPLNMASMLGRLEIVRQLINFPGVDPFIPNRLGHTPKKLAAFYGHHYCFILLDFFEIDKINVGKSEAEQEKIRLALKDEYKRLLSAPLTKSEKRLQERGKAAVRRREQEKMAEEKRAQGQKKDEEKKRKEVLTKKEEDKNRIGQGKGRNARRRKKEEERSRKEEEEGSGGHHEEFVDYIGLLEGQSKELELKPAKASEDTKRIPNERSLLEFIERQILELEEELECPVCLEVATTAPIYKCLDDHLICRLTKLII